MTAHARPYRLDDLVRLTGLVDGGRIKVSLMSDGREYRWRQPAAVAFAELVGVDPASVHRMYRSYGGMLTELTADRWACAAGFHPATVWPEWLRS